MGICFSKSSGSPPHVAQTVSLGTPPGRLQWPPREALEQYQIQQAAYHMGAYLLGEEVANPRRLATAGQTVHDVRLLLKHGRGNVKADDIPSQGHNGIGSSAATRQTTYEDQAARAVLVGAGICDQHAALCAVVHAPHMVDGEISTVTGSRAVPLREITDEGATNAVSAGHTWSELRLGDRDSKSTVVMDAWANGPAVRLQDCAWVAAPIQDKRSMDKISAQDQKNLVEAMAPLRREEVDELVWDRLGRPTPWNKYAEPQVISPEFAGRVGEVLGRCPEDEKVRIASDMIRDTYGIERGSRNHQSAVRSVLQAVSRLDALSRPDVVPSEHITAISRSRARSQSR
ncbi:hypothetical protein Rleg10DRAFT_6659 [Rhizobium leguminosarum bv. trifolii WSM2012]|nr:hypothetical protein Rleg10DRAFT_6659 [Rhizobium leguminosarum bv. trifolii WSM2012]